MAVQLLTMHSFSSLKVLSQLYLLTSDGLVVGLKRLLASVAMTLASVTK